jgi:hypothetical protein
MTKLRKFEKQVGECRSSRKRKSTGTPRRAVYFLVFGFLVMAAATPSAAAKRDKNRSKNVALNAPAILWVQPANIATRDLFYGPGGEDHAPHTTFTFLREDLHGTNPKFDVRDEDGTKWRVKLGAEARPETAASRLLWAVGYFANEDYFLPDLRVEDMKRLKRGQKMVAPDGTMNNVRLKRFLKDEKRVGNWRWHSNPFAGTRELNGLRIMMALMNSWDLKDENNSVYQETTKGATPELHYVVSDLGATFGTPGLSNPHDRSKGNVQAYAGSEFIKKVTAEYVDFSVPAKPSMGAVNPKEFISRVRLEWIGKHIPRADAHWIGQLLSKLSRNQIRQAFQAAGYSPQDVESFTDVVERRIRDLNGL